MEIGCGLAVIAFGTHPGDRRIPCRGCRPDRFAWRLPALWQAGCWAGLISPLKGGSPIGIAQFLWAGLASGILVQNAAVTLGEELLGFAIGVGFGTAAGLGLWWFPTLSKALAPLVAIFNGIPKIALAPPMIVWFGIFEASKIALAAIICLFIAWLSAAEGVRRADPDNTRRMRVET